MNLPNGISRAFSAGFPTFRNSPRSVFVPHARDYGPTSRRVNRALRRLRWQVLRIWEHELSRKNETRLLRRLAAVCGTKPGRT